MGDLVDDGVALGAEKDLEELRSEARSLEVPVIVVPGNHDGDAARMMRLFGDRPGLHRVRGYRLVTFIDRYEPDDKAMRAEHELSVLAQTGEHAGSPIIALQHNPIHPHIESTYPFNLTNAAEVMRAYERAGVMLSVSAHYHPGLAAQDVNGVSYLTCPALCEAPFRFLRLSVRARSFVAREVALQLEPEPPLWDYHVHTEYAYCRDDVTATSALERGQALGVAGMCLTEHAGQLYLSPEDYWPDHFREDAGLIPRERAAGRDRMRRFREEMQALRSPTVGIGLELELDANDELTLLDEDREGWDVLIGAVHMLRSIRRGSSDAGEVARDFMADTERLCALGVHILAHPFRAFRRADLPVPTELYQRVAELLATHGVAAEVNYHTNEPDPRFFELCLEHGVKIALGSDSHALWEVGDLRPHLRLLEGIVGKAELGRVLRQGL
jgi:histidinol phosphatase-like PHP family hydrolase